MSDSSVGYCGQKFCGIIEHINGELNPVFSSKSSSIIQQVRTPGFSP